MSTASLGTEAKANKTNILMTESLVKRIVVILLLDPLKKYPAPNKGTGKNTYELYFDWKTVLPFQDAIVPSCSVAHSRFLS